MEKTLAEIPADYDAEKAALGCVLICDTTLQQDNLLGQLSLSSFHDLRNRETFEQMLFMRQEGLAIDSSTLWLRMKQHSKQPDFPQIGLQIIGELSRAASSVVRFPDYLGLLQKLDLRRLAIRQGEILRDQALDPDFDQVKLRVSLDVLWEKTLKHADHKPKLEVWTVNQYQRYVPDPSTFLVGADIISLGETAVIAGWQGLGKTRLANTLAYAGAKGEGEWMGYAIKRRFKTLVLQSENNPRRIQDETRQWAADLHEYVRISLPTFMQFSDPGFRLELRRFWESWPFDVLIVDNMNDVAREEGRADYLEGLDNIRASLPPFPHCPALIVIAHHRKPRGGENWRPKVGRELMHEISGSLVLTAKARTVFVIQPVTLDTDDKRVVFETAKCNNDEPLPRSAWHVSNNHFLPCSDWNEHEWLNPSAETGSKEITKDMLSGIFAGGKRQLKMGVAIEELRAVSGAAYSTAHRYFNLKTSRFKDFLEEKDGLLSWRG